MSQFTPPIPVQPLYYSTPGPRRPGILTAVGVVSIVVACLSLLGSCSEGVNAVVWYLSPTITRMTAPPATLAAATITPAGRGLEPAQRDALIDGLESVRALSAPQRAMLGKLLDEVGLDAAPVDPSQITATKIAANVSESGRLPTTTPAYYFVLGSGRIEVGDDYAVFTSTDGNQTTRVLDNGSASSVNRTATTTPAPIPAISLQIGPGSMVAALTTAVLSLLLAVFLFVAGIMVLRNSPRGRGLHLAYATVKIPLALISAVVWWMVMTEMMSGTGMSALFGAATGIMSWSLGVGAAFNAMIACAYPVALLIVMRTRTISDYYTSQICQA